MVKRKGQKLPPGYVFQFVVFEALYCQGAKIIDIKFNLKTVFYYFCERTNFNQY